MKNPNGYGSINKLKGNRRRPYWVRTGLKTELVDGKIKHTRQTIGYYATQKEALKALADYNENPYRLDSITLQEIWNSVEAVNANKWTDKRRRELNGIIKNYFKPYLNTNIKEIKAAELQSIIDGCKKKSTTKDNIKIVMHYIFNYALANDYISKDYSQFIKYDKDAPTLERLVFSHEEIQKLWEHAGIYEVDFMLILLYTGCRFAELADNTIDNLDLEAKTISITRDITKTDSSVRVIPIHPDILPVIMRHIGSKWLFDNNGYKIGYKNFHSRKLPIINDLCGVKHTLHDTRHTFTTRLKELDVDLYYIDELVGHVHKNITEDVYTHVNVDRLRQEINKLKY